MDTAQFGSHVAALVHEVIDRINLSILFVDAVGLALFTVNGTLLARDAGLSPVPAALLGVTTGVGGGLIRDVVARDTPLVVRRDSEIYAIPATLGALVVATADANDAYGPAIGIAASDQSGPATPKRRPILSRTTLARWCPFGADPSQLVQQRDSSGSRSRPGQRTTRSLARPRHARSRVLDQARTFADRPTQT
jgi:hypothetical protein